MLAIPFQITLLIDEPMQPLLNNLKLLQQQYQLSVSRNSFGDDIILDSYRVFHGRGRTFNGLEFLCVDFFQPVLLLTFYSQPPINWLDNFLQQAIPLLSPMVSAVLVQERYEPKAPSRLIWGELPAQAFARRGDLNFSLHLGQQQNTGFFLDMEPGRQWLEQHAPGKRILNLFAYTCAFSVVAVAAGAEKVVNVDMSSRALQIGRDNHQRNQLDKRNSEFLAENILKSWGRIKRRGPYDIVIIDPPSYQPGSFVAQKDYARAVRRLPELLPEGGDILACLNAPELGMDFLQTVFAEQCPECKFIERLMPHPDFPDINPEQQLKLLVFRLPSPGLSPQ